MTDLATTLGTDPGPPTTEAPGVADAAAVVPLGSGLPQGVHPRDNSVPLQPGNQPLDQDRAANSDHLGPQGQRRQPPWNVDNEQAYAVYQRAAHDWSANQYTVHSNNPIQVAGRRRGRSSVVIWVPTSASEGVLISPDEGDLTQGAGVTLSPGDSIELPTEATVWAGAIVGQTTGTVYVVEFYNPPGGGLGLSSS